jgi:hypothetical protein
MRHIVGVVLLSCSLFAQTGRLITPAAVQNHGSFFVSGFEYKFVAGNDYVVVAAAHSVVNHKYLGVKVRIVNLSNHVITVKPEDISAADLLGGRPLEQVTGADLARRMSRLTNMARLAVTPMAGTDPDRIVTSSMTDDSEAKWQEAVRELHIRMAEMAAAGAVHNSDMRFADLRAPTATNLPPCDEVCQLRNREAAGPDVLKQLQQQNTPDYVRDQALLANTIPPDGEVDGMLYFPLPKAEHDPDSSKGSKSREVKVGVLVGEEHFDFVLKVE